MPTARTPSPRKPAAKPAPKKSAAKAAPKTPTPDVPVEDLLETFIDKFDPKIAALGRKVLAAMQRRLPGAFMTVYDNYNALVVGFGPHDKVGTTPLSVALYPRWINLFFLKGAQLPDPHKLLQGTGAIVRSIRLTDFAQLSQPGVDELISAAVLQSGWRIDRKAASRMELRLAMPNHRPRRP